MSEKINSDRRDFFNNMTLGEWEVYKRESIKEICRKGSMKKIPARTVAKLEFIDAEHVVIDNDSDDEDVYSKMFDDINEILMQKKEHLERILSNGSSNTEVTNTVNDISIFVKDILSIDCSDKERRMLIDFIERNNVIADIHLMIPEGSCTIHDYDIEI